MSKIKFGLVVAFVVGAALLIVMSGCQRSRYEMGKKIGAPTDAPAYTEGANFQPPASPDTH